MKNFYLKPTIRTNNKKNIHTSGAGTVILVPAPIVTKVMTVVPLVETSK